MTEKAKPENTLYEALSGFLDEESGDFNEQWIDLGRSLGIDGDVNSVDFWMQLAMILAYTYHPDFKIDVDSLNKPKRAGRKQWYEDNEVLSKRVCLVAAIKHTMKEKEINEVTTACRVLLSENNLSNKADYKKLASKFRDLKRNGVVGLVDRLMENNN
ncbi:MAG: hypothetical protein AB2764_11550, partial [Candidatus Thiodiazotropha endolucinida]